MAPRRVTKCLNPRHRAHRPKRPLCAVRGNPCDHNSDRRADGMTHHLDCIRSWEPSRSFKPEQPGAMKRKLWIAGQFAGSSLLLCGTAMLCHSLGSNRATASMVLLLEVLAIATLGDWILALVSSTVASLAFSYYFIEEVGSIRLSSLDGAITFSAMALTAFTGSRLAILAQRRAQEAVHRREEMERLNQFGRVLLAANSLAEASEDAVRKVVELFGLKGAVLRVAGAPHAFQWGAVAADRVSVIPISSDYGADAFWSFTASQPSEEVRNTLASMIRLVLERARGAEERAQMEAIRRGEELRTTVLNAMAHNFRTPLTSIKAAASMLARSPPVPQGPCTSANSSS